MTGRDHVPDAFCDLQNRCNGRRATVYLRIHDPHLGTRSPLVWFVCEGHAVKIEADTSARNADRRAKGWPELRTERATAQELARREADIARAFGRSVP